VQVPLQVTKFALKYNLAREYDYCSCSVQTHNTCLIPRITQLNIFTARLQAMQRVVFPTIFCLSVYPSVYQTCALWQNEKKLVSTFLYDMKDQASCLYS